MAHQDQVKRTISQIKRRNTLSGRFASLLANARAHSKPRGHDAPTITANDLQKLWDKQAGCCAYTGWAMDTFTRSPKLVSIERIDNRRGYDEDNIVLVCWSANSARGKLSTEEFIALCVAVADKHQGKPHDDLNLGDYQPTISQVISWTSRIILNENNVNMQTSEYYNSEIQNVLKSLA